MLHLMKASVTNSFYVLNISESRNREPLATSEVFRSKRSAIKNMLAQRASFGRKHKNAPQKFQDNTKDVSKICYAIPMYQNSKPTGRIKVIVSTQKPNKRYARK